MPAEPLASSLPDLQPLPAGVSGDTLELRTGLVRFVAGGEGRDLLLLHLPGPFEVDPLTGKRLVGLNGAQPAVASAAP